MPRKRSNRKRNTDSDHSPSKRLNNEKISGMIDAQFGKTFIFERPANDGDSPWVLPEAEHVLEPHDELLWNEFSAITDLKNELNSVKDKLSDQDIVPWNKHTRELNIAGKVVPHVRHVARAQLCTQAWCKFYEILCKFQVIPADKELNDTFNSVHLCEAPGAFVASLNHYMRLNRSCKNLSWLAATFNPYYEGNKIGLAIPDDRLIRVTLEHWDFGKDNTGDIFTSYNRASLLERAKKMEPIHLVTADGSIDCQNNPSKQESIVAPLQLAEVVAALRILSPKGSLVVKLFTCFEPASICLMYLLNCAFSNVIVHKPGTSKRGNSEVYVIGLGYKGNSMLELHLSKIEAYLERPFESLAPLFTPQILPQTFMQQMTECCHYFQIRQVEAILEHLSLFGRMTPEVEQETKDARCLMCKKFIDMFCLAQIDAEKEIVKNCQELSKPAISNRPLKSGSLNERLEKASLSWYEELAALENRVVQTMPNLVKKSITNADNKLYAPTVPVELKINVTLGKAFHKCLNTVFCKSSMVLHWNDVCDRFEASGHPSPIFQDLNSQQLADALHDLLMKCEALIKCRFIAQNPACHSLAKHLTKYWTYQPDEDDCPNVHIEDLRYHDSWKVCYTSEATVLYLSRFCNIVERCKKGDWLIIAISPLLTRVDVGLMKILNCGFKEIALLSISPNGQPMEVAFCCDYVHPIAPSILQELRQLGNNDEAILEILDITILFEEAFFDAIDIFNFHAVKERTKFLLTYLKNVAPKKPKKKKNSKRLAN